MSSYQQDPNNKSGYNPFEPPQARVDDVRQRGDDALLADPRRCDTGRGWGWIKDGWKIFSAAPGIWIAIVVVFFIVAVLFSLIPFLNVFSVFLNLILTAGMMVACQAVSDGGAPQVGHLFAGFQRNFGSLMLMGLLYLLAAIVMVLVVAAVVAGVLAAGGHLGPLMQGDFTGLADDNAILYGLLAALVMLALIIPLAMCIWFAPALVILKDMSAFNAMVLSFRGCLRNMLPFLLYGLASMVCVILAALPVGLGLLIWMPVMYGSWYASYREIFLRSP